MSAADLWRGRAWLALLLAGCRSGTEPSDPGLNGNFGGRVLGSRDFVGFALTESDGLISGVAWSGLISSLGHATPLSGSLSGTTVAIRIPAVAGGSEWVFNGTWSGDSLRGEFGSAVRFGYPITIGRVDTIPSGDATIAASGAEQQPALQGSASFGYDEADHPRIVIRTPAPFATTIVVTWNGTSRPARGAYAIPGNSLPSVTIVRDPNTASQSILETTGGTVFVDYSNRFTVAGRIDVAARIPTGGDVRLVGSFSGGCLLSVC